jgi:hypothetical protein
MTASFEPIKHLVPIIGKWDLSTPERPIYNAPQEDLYGRPFGICLSDVRFVEGQVRVTVKIPNSKKGSNASGRILIGYKDWDADYLCVGIDKSELAYVLYQYQKGTGWQPLKRCGDSDNITNDTSYTLLVQVKGQRLVFKENDVTVFEYLLKSPLPIGQLALFAWDSERVEFTDFSVRHERGPAFVVMQFTEPYLGLYNEVIKPTAESDRFKLKAYHAGETFGRIILQDIIRGLEEATVVIAEITHQIRTCSTSLGMLMHYKNRQYF